MEILCIGVCYSLYLLWNFFVSFNHRNTVDGNPRWCCTYLLDPSDSLFTEIGEAFIKQQIKGKLCLHHFLL